MIAPSAAFAPALLRCSLRHCSLRQRRLYLFTISSTRFAGRLGGMVGDILNYIAAEAGFTYRIHVIPEPTCQGFTSWERWTIDQTSRADLVTQWTTDSWQRQTKGVSWPFHHLNLDPVLIVRAKGSSLSIENWEEFVSTSSMGPVCTFGGIAGNAMRNTLGADRVLVPPSDYGESQAHNWAAGQLRAGNCAAYVQPKDSAENMLAEFNAAGGCDLRMRQPSGLPSRGGGFSTIQPFAREHEVRTVSGDPNATTGGGACTDVAIAAFTRILQKMHIEAYPAFRRAEVDAIQAKSGTSLTCNAQDCESGQLDLGAACLECDDVTIDCKQRYTIAVRAGHYRQPTNLSKSALLSVGRYCTRTAPVQPRATAERAS